MHSSPRSTAAYVKRFESAIENAPPKITVSYALFWQMDILIDFFKQTLSAIKPHFSCAGLTRL